MKSKISTYFDVGIDVFIKVATPFVSVFGMFLLGAVVLEIFARILGTPNGWVGIENKFVYYIGSFLMGCLVFYTWREAKK